MNPDLGADAERQQADEQEKIDGADALTETELQEKEDLLNEVHPLTTTSTVYLLKLITLLILSPTPV